MESLEALLAELPDRHGTALRWFADRAGTDIAWPSQLPDGTHLLTRTKGIYRPEWTQFALSIRACLTNPRRPGLDRAGECTFAPSRPPSTANNGGQVIRQTRPRQTPNGPYNDLELVHRADGTWSYAYSQENPDSIDGGKLFTNQALVACMQAKVPVAVMRKVREYPTVLYRVQGLALVARWEGSYFYFEGFASDGHAHEPGPAAQITIMRAEAEASTVEDPQLSSIVDARQRVIASIVRRQGQAAFRQSLLDAYSRRCAISGCDVIEVLEAARIIPYRGPQTNHVTNGLLLRADLHTLFDLGLLAVDGATWRIIVAPSLANSVYASLSGQPLRPPSRADLYPSVDALQQHRSWTGL